MQVIGEYTGNGRKDTDEIAAGTPGKGNIEVEKARVIGDSSLKHLAIAEAPDKFSFNGRPLQVKEALIYVLQRVKDDPKLLGEVRDKIGKEKSSSREEEDYRLLLTKMLNESNEETKKRIEEMDKLEKDWVMVEDNGEELPSFQSYQAPPGWGTTAWKAAKTGGWILWTIGKYSGKATYHLYVESTRIGTIVLLGFMVVENPLFPVLQMVVKHLLLK